MSAENTTSEKIKGHPGFLPFWGSQNKNLDSKKVSEKVDTTNLKDENKE
jgi:hypothetical protein